MWRGSSMMLTVWNRAVSGVEVGWAASLAAKIRQPRSVFFETGGTARIVHFEYSGWRWPRLPGDLATGLVEAAGWAVVAHKRLTNGFGRSFPECLSAAISVYIGSGIAGIYGIHFDGRARKLGSELHRQHVQDGLGAVVADQAIVPRPGPIRIGIPS